MYAYDKKIKKKSQINSHINIVFKSFGIRLGIGICYIPIIRHFGK
jgi:hypothetical protein